MATDRFDIKRIQFEILIKVLGTPFGLEGINIIC